MKAIIEIPRNDDAHRRAIIAARDHANGQAEATDYRLGFESAAQVFAELIADADTGDFASRWCAKHLCTG